MLRSALNEAVRRQRLIANPATIARPPRVPHTEVEPLTREECLAILAAARTRRYAARWSVALAMGLRQGEALGVMGSDIDLAAGTLRIRRAVQRRTYDHGCRLEGSREPTCGRRRGADVPCGATAASSWWRPRPARRDAPSLCRPSSSTSAHPPPPSGRGTARRRGARSDQDLTFPDSTGRPTDPATDRREWESLLQQAGVRDARLHDARHTAAALLLVQGVDLRTLMSIMGWTEMGTAQRYSHAVDELRIEAARRHWHRPVAHGAP